MQTYILFALLLGVIILLLLFINSKLNTIMATQAEHAQQLRDITAQNEKARLEQLQRFADLEAALAAAGSTTPEVDDAMTALKASIQADDDIVPDAPIP